MHSNIDDAHPEELEVAEGSIFKRESRGKTNCNVGSTKHWYSGQRQKDSQDYKEGIRNVMPWLQ